MVYNKLNNLFMNKRILVINGHPKLTSFCRSLAEAYVLGAKKSNFQVDYINLFDLSFNKDFVGQKELETDLIKMQTLITQANHLVIFTPMWWLGLPALLKGFFDRVLTPGYAYKFTKFGVKRLLKGRSARVVYTMGGVKIMYDLLFLGSFWISLKYGMLWLCGFSPVKRTCFSRVPYVNNDLRQKWLKQVEILGEKGK